MQPPKPKEFWGQWPPFVMPCSTLLFGSAVFPGFQGDFDQNVSPVWERDEDRRPTRGGSHSFLQLERHTVNLCCHRLCEWTLHDPQGLYICV